MFLLFVRNPSNSLKDKLIDQSPHHWHPSHLKAGKLGNHFGCSVANDVLFAATSNNEAVDMIFQADMMSNVGAHPSCTSNEAEGTVEKGNYLISKSG